MASFGILFQSEEQILKQEIVFKKLFLSWTLFVAISRPLLCDAYQYEYGISSSREFDELEPNFIK